MTSFADGVVCISKALKACPSLGVYGIGNPPGGMTADESIMERAEFVVQVVFCMEWITAQKLNANLNTSTGSYAYKHCVERWCGEYIPNGALIAAAIGMGLKWRRGRGVTNPNAVFNISRRLVTPKPMTRGGKP